jgi:hypothetical protein
MADVRGSWNEVGERLAALGLKLKLHVEEERAERDGDVDDACTRVRSQIDEVLDALGDAARDPAVRVDVKDVIDRMGDALTVTLQEARRRAAEGLATDDRP